MADDPTTTSAFTAAETKLIMCLIKHMKGELQTDFEAAAVELGYKDATVLKSRWSNVKRKKINGSGAANGEKTTPKKRKSKADVDENDDQENTPTPKKRGRPSKAQNAKEDEEAAAANVKEEEAAEDEANAVESTEKLEGDDQG